MYTTLLSVLQELLESSITFEWGSLEAIMTLHRVGTKATWLQQSPNKPAM